MEQPTESVFEHRCYEHYVPLERANLGRTPCRRQSAPCLDGVAGLRGASKTRSILSGSTRVQARRSLAFATFFTAERYANDVIRSTQAQRLWPKDRVITHACVF